MALRDDATVEDFERASAEELDEWVNYQRYLQDRRAEIRARERAAVEARWLGPLCYWLIGAPFVLGPIAFGVTAPRFEVPAVVLLVCVVAFVVAIVRDDQNAARIKGVPSATWSGEAGLMVVCIIVGLVITFVWTLLVGTGLSKVLQ